MTWHGGEDFADVIMLRTLNWGDGPGLSEWAQYNHKGPCRREAGESLAVAGDVTTESRRWSDMRKGPRAKEFR